MDIIQLDIPDALLIKPEFLIDKLVFFMKTCLLMKMSNSGNHYEFVQDNHSSSTRGTLRGLQYQIENPQGKLVRVTSGEIYDVAVDIHQSSLTFEKRIRASHSEII